MTDTLHLHTTVTVKTCDGQEIQTYFSLKAAFKVFLHVGHRDFVLRSFGSTAAWNHCVQIQFHNLEGNIDT